MVTLTGQFGNTITISRSGKLTIRDVDNTTALNITLDDLTAQLLVNNIVNIMNARSQQEQVAPDGSTEPAGPVLSRVQ